MAREEENSAISLFSFQDIITSLTGIMFLVVLMLLLVVLSPHGALFAELDPETRALQTEVKALREELSKLSTDSDAITRELEKLSTLSESELSDRLDAARETLATLKAEGELEAQQFRLLCARFEAMQKEIERLKNVNESLEKSLPESEQNLAELQKKVEETEVQLRRREKVMDFTVPRPSGKTPQLVELSADGARLLSPDDGKSLDFRVTGNSGASLAKVQKYLDEHRGEAIYFCVVVRPDGFPLAYKVLACIDLAGFERGVEFLPSSDLTIFDEAQL